MGVFPRGSGAPAPCCLTSGSLTLRSAPLCEAPRSSPAPSPPRLLSVCPIVLCPSLPHLWGSQFLFLVLLFLSQGSPFFSFPASLDLSLCPPCPPSLLSQGNSPSRLRTQRRPPSNTCHPSPFSPPSPSTRGPSPQAPHLHSPLGATRPQQHNAQHQANRTLPILGALTAWCPEDGHQAVSAKLSSEVAGHPAREGAGPGCPRPSPQLPAPPALIWHCPPGTAWWLGGVPRGLGSAGCLPSSSASFSPSQTSGNTFSAPGSPSLLPPPTGLEPKRPPGLRGVNAERRGPVRS